MGVRSRGPWHGCEGAHRVRNRPRLVLAGMGHAHLFVLEAARRGKLPPCELVVCTGDALHAYSGMLPGWLAGRYRADEVSLDVASLVRRAGGVLHGAAVAGLIPSSRHVTLSSGEVVPYDVCSIAVGSEPGGGSVPGVARHAVPVKPWASAVELAARIDALRAAGGRVVVVGGGLAGVEVALAIRARVARDAASVSLVAASPRLATDRHPRLGARLALLCARHQVQLRLGTTATRVSDTRIWLADGDGVSSEPADLVVWVGGASAPGWLHSTGLPLDGRGFLRVDEVLRSPADPRIHAAGDVASLDSSPRTPKAGVYAVRMGPLLVRSLAHALGSGVRPSAYRPQRRFLALVNRGDGGALVSWGGLVAEGGWAMQWKDRIDRRFMRRFTLDG